MIIKLTGNVSYHGKDFIILDVGSVSYKLFVPDFAVRRFEGEMTIFTHEVSREDAHELLAFSSMAALELFGRLVSISGVGPRIAQKIIFADELERVSANIARGELSFLTGISGVGKKTAQKIILELSGELVNEEGHADMDTDAIEALASLGYTRRQAEEALTHIEAETTEDRIRIALQMLGK